MDLTRFITVPKPIIKDKNILPIVMAADNNYAPYTGIAIYSMLKHASPDDYYDIVILDDGITDENRNKIFHLANNNNNVQIRFLELKHLLTDAPAGRHFSKTAYLRLYIPFMFREYEKVLYLDSDIIVIENIAPLVATAMSNEYIACVRATRMIQRLFDKKSMKLADKKITVSEYFTDMLGFKPNEFENYVNSGVILYNIEAFINDNFKILNDLDSHIYKGYPMVDQCIVNIIFKNIIKYLHPKWNVMIPLKQTESLSQTLIDQFSDANNNPAILHYTTGKKPWNQLEHEESDIFWQYCKNTPWYGEIQNKLLSTKFRPWLNKSTVNYQQNASPAPQISIIMPVYNQAETVEKAIKSILLQNFTNFELLIINDGSSDDSCSVIKKYSDLDSRIKLLYMPSNQGSGPARNFGLKHALGQYIRFCDADDFYPQNCLNALFNQTDKGESDIIVGNIALFYHRDKSIRLNNNHTYISKPENGCCFANTPQLWRPFQYHRIMFRKQFLLDNNIEFPALWRGQDPVFLTEVLVKAKKIVTIQDPTYIFHLRPRNRQFSFEQARDILRSRLLITEKFNKAGYPNIAKLNIVHHSPPRFNIPNFPEEQALELATMLLSIYNELQVTDIVAENFTPYKLNIPVAKKLLQQLANYTPELLIKNLKANLINFELRDEPEKTKRLNALKTLKTAKEKTKIQTELDEVYNSASWKITKPLRIIKMFITDHQGFKQKLKTKLRNKNG